MNIEGKINKMFEISQSPRKIRAVSLCISDSLICCGSGYIIKLYMLWCLIYRVFIYIVGSDIRKLPIDRLPIGSLSIGRLPMGRIWFGVLSGGSNKDLKKYI